jgi:hypothetical protein
MLRCLYLRRLNGFEKGIFRVIVEERFGFWRGEVSDPMLGRFGSELIDDRMRVEKLEMIGGA